jgi:DNA-binding response OmpR family regulator
MVPNVSEPHLDLERKSEVRILAMVPLERQKQIQNHLAPLGMTIDFISKAAEVSQLALAETTYDVALLPAALPDHDWWSLWGEIAQLNPRPEILVYAHKPTFQLWSGVLEAGGYDVLVEPLTAEELQRAVLRAAKSFAEKL